MKKLMIAAAAAATVGGVYATTGCEGCAVNVVEKEATTQTIEVVPCAVTAYNVQFKLKTLVSKGVKSGDCQGYCMEQGTRTLDGILWSCCTQCEDWNPCDANYGTFEPFQYTLWEKANKRCFTGGMAHQNGSTTSTASYSATASYVIDPVALVGATTYPSEAAAKAAGYSKVTALGLSTATLNVGTEQAAYKYCYLANTWQAKNGGVVIAEKTVAQSAYIYDTPEDAIDALKATKPTDSYTLKDTPTAQANPTVSYVYTLRLYNNGLINVAVPGTGSQATLLTAAKAYNPFAEFGAQAYYIEGSIAYTQSGSTDTTVATSYIDTDADITMYRFGKKATSVEVLWNIDTYNDTLNWAGTFKTNEEDAGLTPDNVVLTAAGFGTAMQDGEDVNGPIYVAKSVSGNCAGYIIPIMTENCAGSIMDMCEEFTSWCFDGWEAGQWDNTGSCVDVFASGTWTMKYIQKLSKGFEGVVPSYAGIQYL